MRKKVINDLGELKKEYKREKNKKIMEENITAERHEISDKKGPTRQ